MIRVFLIDSQAQDPDLSHSFSKQAVEDMKESLLDSLKQVFIEAINRGTVIRKIAITITYKVNED